MIVTELDIPGLLLIEPKIYGDHRGWFVETYNAERYEKLGIPTTRISRVSQFVQDNMSYSKKGILRGLHIQKPYQGKLVQVIEGEIYDVAVDLRPDSATFGRWYGLILSSENKKQFWIPEGFAHGFYVLSETALFSYKCTNLYAPQNESTILWNDPVIGIEWPLWSKGLVAVCCQPILSEKDRIGFTLQEYTSKIK